MGFSFMLIITQMSGGSPKPPIELLKTTISGMWKQEEGVIIEQVHAEAKSIGSSLEQMNADLLGAIRFDGDRQSEKLDEILLKLNRLSYIAEFQSQKEGGEIQVPQLAEREELCFQLSDCPPFTCDQCIEECDDMCKESNVPIRIPDKPIGIFYIVCGAESSGNRYTVSMLKSAGCVCESGHQQPWDVNGIRFSQINVDKLRRERPTCAAVHRSYPHNGQWVDLRAMMSQIAEAGYEPRVIYITRNPLAVVQSQLRVGHTKAAKKAYANIMRAKREIFRYIGNSDVRFLEIEYEQYAFPTYIRYVYSELGFNGIPAAHPPFDNKNSKYNLEK